MNPLDFLAEFVLPLITIGLVFGGIILFLSTIIRFPEKKYSAVLTISVVSFFFLISEFMVHFFLKIHFQPFLAARFFVIELACESFYFIVISFFIREYLTLNPFFSRVNLFLYRSGYVITALFLLLILIYREGFVDIQSLIGMYQSGEAGLQEAVRPLYYIQKWLILLLMAYSLLAVILDQVFNKSFREMFPVFFGSVIALSFICFALFRILFGHSKGLPSSLHFSFFSLGLGLFTFSVFWGIFRVFLIRARDLENTRKALVESEGKMRHMALRDDMTGLANRRAFYHDMDEKLLITDSNVLPDGCVIIMDLDNFMDLNESYGHEAGDMVLKEVSDRLKKNISPEIFLYRVGGDEFAFFIPHIRNHEDPIIVATQIQGLLSQGVDVLGEWFPIEGALGIAYFPRDGHNARLLIKNAYSALKVAKARHNSIEIFSPVLHRESINRITLVLGLRTSLKNRDFYLEYQPILDQDRKIVSVEALVRWKGTKKHVAGPGVFIPLAESAGLMNDLGKQIMETFIGDYHFLAKLSGDLIYSINLSPSQFYNQDLCSFLLDILKGHQVPLNQIQFEITETLFLDNYSVSLDILSCLRENGVKIALDDFGTGYSSLQYLQSLPVDTLKIDRTFLTEVPGSLQAESIITAILHLVKAFKIKVVTEGVETLEQFDFLKKAGCHFYQGYLFHRPMKKELLYSLLQGKES